VNTAAVSVWRGIGVLLLLSLILLLLLYWSTVVSLVEQWQTSSYSYAFLTVPIAGFLAWRNREQLAKSTPTPAFWVLPGIALLGFGWLVGDLTATNFLEHLCFMSVIIVFVWGLVGKRVGSQLHFPLGFLMFAIPAGQDLIPLLQDFSAWSAVKLLELTRIPVLLGSLWQVGGGGGMQWYQLPSCVTRCWVRVRRRDVPELGSPDQLPRCIIHCSSSGKRFARLWNHPSWIFGGR